MIRTGKLFSFSCNSHTGEREAGGLESYGFCNKPFNNTMQCAVRTGFVFLCRLCLNYLPARYFICLLIHRQLSLFSTTPQYRNTSPPSHPPLTTYIKLDIFSLPAVFSYFVGNYFSFDTSGLQCEFKVQPAKSIEI